MLISVILPVIRPEKAARCIEALCGKAWKVGYVAHCEAEGHNLEVLPLEDTSRIGCPRMVKVITAQAQGDFFLFLGDDTIPQPGMITAALEAMATLPDGWGLVGLNDGIHQGTVATHWLADRRVLDLVGGEFFHTGYRHCFCDRELTDICREDGRYVYAETARLVHDHPAKTGEAPDADYARVYSPEVYEDDRALYHQRKRARLGFRLAIGFPLVDATVPVQFFQSFVCMDKPESYTFLTPRFPHGPWSSSLAEARNSLVEQAQEEGASHLLMLDTDQVYPADTLTRLLAHDVDVCGVRVHRRWPPFDVIMMRGQLGSYKHLPDEDCFSGKLVDVDATGTGCLLFNMEVFDRVPRPWFMCGRHTDGKPYGEDIYFCDQARRAGVRICVDTGIEVGHLTTHTIGRGTYELFKRTSNFHWAE